MKANISKIILFIFSAFYIVGCSDIENIGKAPVSYKVMTPNVSSSDLQILTSRFNSFLPSLFSEVKLDPKTNVFTFINGAPNHHDIQYLATQLGQLTIGLELAHNPWISNHQIKSTGTSQDGDTVYLSLLLTDQAAKYFADQTEKHIGEKLIVRIDGEVLTNGTIRQKLGQAFKITTPFKTSQEAARLAQIIKNGPLSQPVQVELIPTTVN